MTNLDLIVRRMEHIREELMEDQTLSKRRVKEMRKEYNALMADLLSRANTPPAAEAKGEAI